MDANDNNSAKSVAELEIEQREKAASNQRVLAVGEMMSDPSVSEIHKDVACLLVLESMMTEHMKSPAFKEHTDKWTKIQTAMMESLKFGGSTVEIYDPQTDGLSGAFLEYVTGIYEVEIDVEDADSLDDIACFVVKVYKSRGSRKRSGRESKNEKDEDESGSIALIADGCVKNIEAAQRVCQLLKDGNEEHALALLKDFDEL